MTVNSLIKYYKIGALYPFYLIFLFSISTGIIFYLFEIVGDYKSNWYTSEGVWLSELAAILLSAFMCILSATLFLNKITVIKKNVLLSLIAWFAVPISFVIFFVIQSVQIIRSIYYEYGDASLMIFRYYEVLICFIHSLGLLVSYLRFSAKNLKV